jgi:hypothetical protein
MLLNFPKVGFKKLEGFSQTFTLQVRLSGRSIKPGSLTGTQLKSTSKAHSHRKNTFLRTNGRTLSFDSFSNGRTLYSTVKNPVRSP